MKIGLLSCTVAGLWLMPAAQSDAVKKDLAALQGTWNLVAMEVDGQEVKADKLKGTTLTIRDHTYGVLAGKQLREVEITLDPTKTPKEIDMKFLDGPHKDAVGKGIYRLEGDTLTICRGLEPQQERPKDFKTAGKIGYFVMVWQRQP
jgi:uncharacterized protein (TIGR03067 family)